MPGGDHGRHDRERHDGGLAVRRARRRGRAAVGRVLARRPHGPATDGPARARRARAPGHRPLGDLAQQGDDVLARVVTALGTVGVNVTALVAGLGLTGFALGFAFRDVLSNLLAGLLLLVYRPFARHDLISETGYEGTVAGVDLRYTTLQRDDGKVLIPNSILFTNPIQLRS